MVDLSSLAGLSFHFDPERMHFAFGPEVRDPLYGTRSPHDIRKVLLDADCELPDIIYWMLRDLGLKEMPDYKQLHGLRYDISIFHGCTFGPEFMKTSGHYHPVIPGRTSAWPEVYEVLHGKALYLLQKVDDIDADPKNARVEDMIIVEGNPGDKIIMPPNYGHVTINPLDTPLVMSNWVSSRFSSVYGKVEAARGFAYYLLHGDGRPQWIRNTRYNAFPPLRRAQVCEVPALGLEKNVPLFQAGLAHPEKLAFLNDPDAWMEAIWSGLRIVDEVNVSV